MTRYGIYEPLRKEYPEMNADSIFRFGYLTVFGFTKDHEFLERKLPNRLGIVPYTIDFGPAGRFFFYSSYGDLAETEKASVLKLGFVRSPTMSPLSAKELLIQKAVSPEAIDHRVFRGNALVASFSRIEASFSAFKTILSTPQLYYTASKDGILCATGLGPLIAMLDRLELNEDAIVPQFLFGTVLGCATIFRNVYRLFPGELLRWKDGELTVKLAQDLRFADNDLRFERADSQALDILYERFKGIIEVYVNDIEASGDGFGNLLSGGVDSSLLQLAINEARPSSRARSFSYAVHVPSFEREIGYARQAAAIFDTEHNITDIAEEEFPNLLVKATNILAQPVLTHAEVCKLGHAEALSKMADAPRFFFGAAGADTLFGVDTTKKLKIIERLTKVPASEKALTLGGTLLKPLSRRGQTLLNLADILRHRDDPAHFADPINSEDTIGDFTLARRCFGDEAVRKALADRRERAAKYLDTSDYTEKVHAVVLFSDCYEVEVQSRQLFLPYCMERLYPFMDEDVIRLSFAFRPQVRYIRGQRHKYILKDLLEQRTATPITRQAKGGSMFHPDLHRWMQSGSLRDMVSGISLPGCLSRRDFDDLVANPGLVLWHLLAFDIFQKHVLAQAQQLQRRGGTLELN